MLRRRVHYPSIPTSIADLGLLKSLATDVESKPHWRNLDLSLRQSTPNVKDTQQELRIQWLLL